MTEFSKKQERDRSKFTKIIKYIAASALLTSGSLLPIRDNCEPDFELLQSHSYNKIAVDSITITTANVHRWKLHGEGNYQRFVDVLERRKPDVVCMQEVLADKGQLRDLHELGYNIYFFASTNEFIDGRYGNAVASKSQLIDANAMILPSKNEDSHRNAINFRINSSRGLINFTSTHLDTNKAYSDKQIVYINSNVGQTVDFGCGDFNRSLKDMQSSPLGSMTNKNKFLTFPSIKPVIQLDHIITSCGTLSSDAMLDDFGSDHLSVTKTFDIKNCSETHS